MLLVDDRLVKSEESDVILECGRVVRLVDGLAPDLVVLVWQLLALVSHIPLTKADLRIMQLSFGSLGSILCFYLHGRDGSGVDAMRSCYHPLL